MSPNPPQANVFQPKALIFDLDGTLADTMPSHLRAWTQVTQAHGLHFPEERFYAMGGVPSRVILRTLADEAGVSVDENALAEQKEDLFLQSLDMLQPVEPVLTIAAAHRGQLPMGIATGGYRRIAEKILDQLGITDWFDAFVTANDITDPKPHPETFLKAAEQLGVAPADCRAYEDTDLGMQAIRAAGMDAVDIRDLVSV